MGRGQGALSARSGACRFLSFSHTRLPSSHPRQPSSHPRRPKCHTETVGHTSTHVLFCARMHPSTARIRTSILINPTRCTRGPRVSTPALHDPTTTMRLLLSTHSHILILPWTYPFGVASRSLAQSAGAWIHRPANSNHRGDGITEINTVLSLDLLDGLYLGGPISDRPSHSFDSSSLRTLNDSV